MRGLLSETVNHKLSAEGIILWVPTLTSLLSSKAVDFRQDQLGRSALSSNETTPFLAKDVARRLSRDYLTP